MLTAITTGFVLGILIVGLQYYSKSIYLQNHLKPGNNRYQLNNSTSSGLFTDCAMGYVLAI